MIHVQRRRRIRRSPAGWRFGLLAIWLGAGAAAAQERIYVAQINPPQIHIYEFSAGIFTHQPDGGSPLVPGSEAWNLAATDEMLLAGSPQSGVGFRAISPDGVVTPPVENATVAGGLGGGIFLKGTFAILAAEQPPAVSVVNFDASSPVFMRQIDSISLGGGKAMQAVLSPDGSTLYVARTQAALPSSDTLIDAIDVSALPALTLLHTTSIPSSGSNLGRANSLRAFSLGGRDYLALFRHDLQFLELDAALAPQLVHTVRWGHPSPDAASLRHFYDGAFHAASERALVVADTLDNSGNGTAFHELLALDLSALDDATPTVTLAAWVETEAPFTTRQDRSQFLAPSLAGSELFHLTNASAPGTFESRLRAYDLAPLLAGAGEISLTSVELDTVEVDPSTPSVGVEALLVRDRVEPASPAPAIADAVNEMETDPNKKRLLSNDEARTIRVSGSGLGDVSRAFLGSSWLSGVTADGGDILATMAALTPAGDERLGVVAGNGGLAAFDGLKVVNPPQFLPAAVAYVSDFAGNTITVLNSSSETEVVTSFASGVQGPFGVEVSRDGKFLYVTGFHDGDLSVYCLIAGADGAGCDWNGVAATLPLHQSSAPADMELSVAGDRLFVNELFPGVVALDTTTVPPTQVGRIWTSTQDLFDFVRVQRAIALESSATPAGDWLYIASDVPPHVGAVEVSTLAGDLTEEQVSWIDVPGLPEGRSRSDGLAVHPDGSRLFFTNLWSTAVSVCAIDPFDGSNVDCSGTLPPIPLAGAVADIRHLAVSPDGRFLYVAARGLGTTEVIELAATSSCAEPPCFVDSLPTGVGSNGVRVSASEEYVYVAALGINAVSVIQRDLASPPLHRLLTVSSTGLQPAEVALTPGVETEVGSDVTVTPTEGVEVTFDDVTAEGSTTVTSANTSEYSLPADFQVAGGGVAVFYDVNTTAEFEGLVTICFAYDDTGMTLVEEESLVLLHEETCSPLLESAGATGCDAGGYGTELLTDWTEFTCTASGVSKGDCASGQEGTTLAGYITQLPVDTASNTICGRVGSFSQFVAAVRTVWLVAIDILPGESPNEINQRSQGKLEVAIFSSPLVDATAVVVSTVELAGVAAQAKSEIEDVDGDGRDDLVVKFEPPTLGLGAGAHALEFTGELADGRRIRGSDSLTVK
jgi:DNA-binding beta-propeller fold protein YncE